MKKHVALMLMVLVLMAVVVGCDQTPKTKALIVVNNSTDTDIEVVEIRQNIVSRSANPYNALPDGEVIAPGAQMTFYIAPFAYSDTANLVGLTYLRINFNLTGEFGAYFSFNPDVKEDITATYDGTTFVLSGSNAEIPIV
jgi:hypothetical protein